MNEGCWRNPTQLGLNISSQESPLKTPILNGSIELIVKMLDIHLFRNLDDVRNITTEWMYDYNHERPHSALGGIPPKALCHPPSEKSLLLIGT